ncbi:MAG: dihydrolipoyl dehydrogenase [Opitutales bacterium]
MAAENSEYDLVVIGGGPAGYAGAIRAGQLGKKVACIEMERPGGTCLNWGCIPSKALLKSAEIFTAIQHADEYGLSVEGASFDYAKVIERSRGVSDRMAKGVEFLFKKNKVEHIVGKGMVNVPGMVEITEGEAKGRVLRTKNVLLAPGCKARSLPDLKPDGEKVFTSREILEARKMPESIIVLGAGAIGVEFAYFLNALGGDVRLVEMLPHIVPVEDEEVSKTLEREFKKQGIKVHTNTKAENVKVTKKGVSMDLVKGDAKESVEAAALLLAIGVTAYTDGLLSNRIKLDMDRGYFVVGDDYQTSTKGIYAAGDVIGPPWLAHVATYEAVQAVNGMFEEDFVPRRVTQFPGCTYCNPQVASIGLTERAAKEKGLDYRVGKFPFAAAGKAVASNHPEGFVKLITETNTGEILGAHIIGTEATELIAEYGLGMTLEATWEEVHATIHAHPTLSEALGEAAAAVNNEAIHI